MSGGAHGGGPPPDPPLRSLLWRAGGRFLFRWTFRTWYGPRRLILKLFGTRLTPRTKFRRTARIERPWNLSAGTLTVVADHVILRGRHPITIGDRCIISQLAVLTTERRDHRASGFPTVAAPITLEDDVWIATDTLVLPGSRVGAGTVVGARCLVEGELPGWMIATGEPAVPKRPRVLKVGEAAP
ncbi:MAG: LbetaH domain-containing protein [Planctomycetota bacterium]